MVNIRSRGFWLRFIPIIFIISADIFFLVFLDNYFYNVKRTIISESGQKWSEIFEDEDFDNLKVELNRLINDPSNSKKKNPNYTQLATEYLIKNASKIIEGNNPFVSVILKDEYDKIVFELHDQNKLNLLNHWRNSLFSQSFIAFITTPNTQIQVGYATPPDIKEIETVAWRYKIYAAIFVILSWVIYFLLSNMVVRPLLKVDEGIERIIRTGNVSLIHNPRNDTEKAFNQLMRTQREVFLSVVVDQAVDQLHHITDDYEVITLFLGEMAMRIPSVYPFQKVQAFILQNNQWLTGSNKTPNSDLPDPGQPPIVIQSPDTLSIRVQHNNETVGMIQCTFNKNEQSNEELYRIGSEIEKQVNNGIARCIGRSRTLTEERNRFGINIATNMGHDLTNIIASGKWDLDTINRAQTLGIIQTDAQKGKYYTEAVDGLRNNLYFLQEMVDIYRSFAHTQHPHFETVDLAHLTKDITQLFTRSTSKKLTIDVTAPETIEAYVEPRLLRMALFNLLNNAAQAIVQSEPPVVAGRISINLQVDEDRHAVFEVRDNGPGICSEDGELLPETQIARIFQSGYSTKGKSSGGGLGLSWVRSIIHDFHHGEITAHNHPNGGAVFRFVLPNQSNDNTNDIPNQTTLKAFNESKSSLPKFNSVEELRKDLLS